MTRGKRAPFTVDPLPVAKDESGRDWLVELAKAEGDADLIGALGTAAKAAGAAEPVLAVIRKAYHDASGRN